MTRMQAGKLLLVFALVAGLAYATPVVAQESEEMVEIEYKGEVVQVDGNTLITKMIPSGNVRTFTVAEGREFLIDGKTVTIDGLEPGTVLSAKAMVVPSEEVLTTVTGTVMRVVARTAIIRLDDGSVKSYTVDSDFTFDVSGEPTTVMDLKEGTKITATRIKADPETVITPETPITGTAPK